MAKKKPKRVDIYSRGQERKKAMEAAGDLTSKPPEKIKQDQAIDNIFEDIKNDQEPVEQNVIMDYIDYLFNTGKEG